MLQEPLTSIYWLDTLVMLADALTKVDADASILRTSMVEGRYSIKATEEAMQNKERTREARQRAKAARDAAKARSSLSTWWDGHREALCDGKCNCSLASGSETMLFYVL